MWHTLEQKEHSVASAARAGLWFKRQQERLESCGVRRERRRCLGDTETSGEKRKREKRACTQNLDGYGGCEDVRPARWSCFSFAVREERPRRDYNQQR